MFKKIDFADAKGKTIRAVVVANDDELIVSFTDNTFSMIRADSANEMYGEIETDGYFDACNHRGDLVLEPAFGESAKAMHAAAVVARAKRERASSERAFTRLYSRSRRK